MSDDKKYRVKNKFLRAIMGNYAREQLGFNTDYDLWGLTHGKGAGSTILTYIVKKHSISTACHFMKTDTSQIVVTMLFIFIKINPL